MNITEVIKQLTAIFNIVDKFLKDKGIPEQKNQVKEITIKALEKQIPEYPRKEKDNYSDEVEYYCPECNYYFGEENFEYCPDCGQKIKWSGK